MTIFRRWRKSSRSQNGGTCIEIAHTLDALRDSKNPAGPTLLVPTIVPLLHSVKVGHFDR